MSGHPAGGLSLDKVLSADRSDLLGAREVPWPDQISLFWFLALPLFLQVFQASIS
jgi:hypothetical protein